MNETRTERDLRSYAARFGVTRLGALTALDRLGIEIAAAVRSEVVGESITVCSGRGWTRLQAEDSALGEALERFAAEPRGRLQIESATIGFDSSIDPALLILDEDIALEPGMLFEWVRGKSLVDSSDRWVPANAVFFPYIANDGHQELFSAQTTGLAAGRTFEEAATAGLLECIERDALSVAAARIQVGEADLIPGIPFERTSHRLSEAVARASETGLKVFGRDLTIDPAVPVALVTIIDADLGVAHFGVAADLKLIAATERAFLEAAQSRAVWIQAAREDLPEVAESPHSFFNSSPQLWSLMHETASDIPAATSQLSFLVGRACDSFGHSPIVVDLSIEAVPFFVVRVITPCAEVWAIDPHRHGSRVRSWLSKR